MGREGIVAAGRSKKQERGSQVEKVYEQQKTT